MVYHQQTCQNIYIPTFKIAYENVEKIQALTLATFSFQQNMIALASKMGMAFF